METKAEETSNRGAHSQSNSTAVFEEIQRLVKATTNGQLDERARVEQFDGQDKVMLQGINDLIDAFAAPFNLMAEYVDRVSKGDIPEKITDDYKGDFNEVKNNLNALIVALNGLIDGAATMANAAAAGELDTRVDASGYEGVWKTIIQGLNDTVEGVVVPLRDIGGVLDKMAAGDLQAQVTNDYQGDYNVLKVACNELGVQLQGVQKVLHDLQGAITDGKLDTRGDASRFKGEIAGMVDGLNGVIDAFAAPFNLMAEYVDRVSKGDIPEKITDDYKGDFNEVKNNLNALLVVLNGLIDGAATMANAAAAGDLDTRVDASGYEGVWKTIVQGLNNTLEGVAEPLNEVAKVLAAMAQKDCTQRVTGDYKGQYKHLKDNINDTAAAIDEAMTQVAQAVEQVAAAAAQVSAASQSLAEGATEQAAGLEETSSSLEEMASMTKQNADNAQQANTLSDEGKKFADNGTEAMNKMTQAINEIQKSSDETAKIIKVIDEIAFQTNLLALNAAVEAARAGEAGKGFAVVAEEVRNLAMRSAEAAKNTANMIEESVKNSKNGVDIAVEVGKALEEIVTSVSKASELVSEIAAASQEQAQGIDQVNTAVAQMDKVTQQNAANAEESASASEELSAQADALGAMVQEFVLSTSGGSVAGRQRGGHATTRAAGKPRKLAGKHHNFGSSDQAWHQIAGGSGKAAQRSQKKTVPSAERAIPLDESTDGLEEFNA